MVTDKVLVKDWMTSNPYTVSPSTHLTKAIKLMKESNIRRLPVVKDNKLVGIVTDGDIREAGPSDLSSLGKYESNYLLSGMVIEDVMTKDPIIVSSQDTIREITEIMMNKKFGGFPVVDDTELVGIITVSDVFKVLLEVFQE